MMESKLHRLGIMRLATSQMRPKIQKPPICFGGSENYALWIAPLYMNVPSPAPCHVNVAGVAKQSVRGLRIIACISLITLALFRKSVNSPEWLALGSWA